MFLRTAYYVIFYMCLLFTSLKMNKCQSINQSINCIQQHTFCKYKSGLKYLLNDKFSDKFEFLDCDFINR